MRKSVVGCLITISLLGACAPIKDATLHNQIIASKCNQQNQYRYTVADLPTALDDIAVDTALRHKLSAGSLHIANTIGII